MSEERSIDTDQGYRIGYGGGRLATVYIDGAPVEGVPVRSMDGSKGGPFSGPHWLEPEPDDDAIRAKVAEWLSPEDMPNYRAQAAARNAANRRHRREHPEQYD